MSNWKYEGSIVSTTMIIDTALGGMFNQSTWKLVWESESFPNTWKGLYIISLFVFFLMMFFGVMGMIVYTKNPDL